MKKTALFLALLTPSFGGCGDSEYEYSSYKAYFVFDNSQHLDATLSSAMNALSPGIFCRISTNGSNYFDFNSSQGAYTKQAMNAIDKQRTCVLGIDNGSGIIVGYGMLSDPAVFYAYDAQCPNCYEQSNKPNSKLSMGENGQASCSKCSRTYDMNNSGIITSGTEGKKLIRYRASTTGPMGILSVNN